METGEATWDESLLLFLERSGYVEETYHTFSYSPLVDDDNVIQGMLCVVKEDTDEVHRRPADGDAARPRHPGQRPHEARRSRRRAEHLAANPWSLPFTLTYLFDADGRHRRLAGHDRVRAGDAPGRAGAVRRRRPRRRPGRPSGLAPRRDGDSSRTSSERFADLPTGAWQDPPGRAVVVPLAAAGPAGAVRLPRGRRSTPTARSTRGTRRSCG